MADERKPLDDRPLVLDELSKQLEQFRILRTGADTDATERLLDQLGAQDPVEEQIVLELSAQTPLAHPERFTEAHVLAMRALEVLDRNGARAPKVPGIGPLKPVAEFGVQFVTRFLVRNYESDLSDAIRNLYTRRLAWTAPDDPSRLTLVRARLDADKVSATYNGNPIGIPTFVLGGAVISGAASGLRVVGDAALGSRLAAGLAVATAFIVLAVLSWMILRGAAVAHHRIRTTTEAPVRALWETIGRCGNPPEDDAQTFAIYAVILTVLGWLLIPAGVFFLVSYF
ncbi:MAG TPA: hypothetical protein VFV00_02910 [Acidimicrobiales bacterium]|nr:hypothetical protein [Acidimicrobiales bacterium]